MLLDTREIYTLKVPENVDTSRKIYDVEEYRAKNTNGNYNYFDVDEEIFETKSGQVFSKFVNDKLINNKLNKFSSKIEQRIQE